MTTTAEAADLAETLTPQDELVLGPWDGRGGVAYEWDPVTQRDIPTFRVVTVGFSFPDPRQFEKATIREAIDFLSNEPLRFKDGSIAMKNLLEQYRPSKVELIVINQGLHQVSTLPLAMWVQLVADGAVTIKGAGLDRQLIHVRKIVGRGDTPPPIQIGGDASVIARYGGTFRLEPSASALAANSSQRGINCDPGQSLNIFDTTFSGFRAYGPGAAIRNFHGKATHCTFENCFASVTAVQPSHDTPEEALASGGAIFGRHERSEPLLYGKSKYEVWRNYSRPTVDNCTFTNCTSEHNGGAVSQFLLVTACSFTRCVAAGSGGACYDVTQVVGTTFDGCTANHRGGALAEVMGWVDDLRIRGYKDTKARFDELFAVQRCTFKDGSATEGGAIARCEVIVSDCFIDHNTAVRAGGGGLYAVSGNIDRCSITRNSAVVPPAMKKPGSHNGGGLHSCSGRITNCIVAANHARGDGGGLFNCDGALRHLDILQNKADGVGGGARSCNGPIQNCIVLGNWSLRSGVKADSNQLSNCAPPQNCFLPKGWTGGSGNVKDKGEGPGFETPMPKGPGADPDDEFGREDDPTTLPYYSMTDVDDAKKLRLTDASKDSGLLDSGKTNLGVDRDFENGARPNPADRKRPDIGAFEYPPTYA